MRARYVVAWRMCPICTRVFDPGCPSAARLRFTCSKRCGAFRAGRRYAAKVRATLGITKAQQVAAARERIRIRNRETGRRLRALPHNDPRWIAYKKNKRLSEAMATHPLLKEVKEWRPALKNLHRLRSLLQSKALRDRSLSLGSGRSQPAQTSQNL